MAEWVDPFSSRTDPFLSSKNRKEEEDEEEEEEEEAEDTLQKRAGKKVGR